MKRTILRTAFRNFVSHPFISSLHLFGLALGVACFTLDVLYVSNELSFDDFHSRGNDIYRVYEWSNGIITGSPSGDASLSLPLGSALQQDFPGVESYTRVQAAPAEYTIRTSTAIFHSSVTAVDNNFFKFFSFRLLAGNPENVLQDPNSVVLDEETSGKMFGTVDPVGKLIQIKIDDQFRPFIVKGIAKSTANNSSIHFNILTNIASYAATGFGKFAVGNWSASGFQTFVRIRPGSLAKMNNNAMFNFRKKHLPSEAEQLVAAGLWDPRKPYPVEFGFQPLKSIHTDPTISASGETGINVRSLWITLAICLTILIIACVNYTTLTISLSAKRTKEISLKKIFGGSRKQIFKQVILESLVNSIIATLIALCLTAMLLPAFNDVTGSKLTLGLRELRFMVWLFPLIVLITNIFSGLYPAWMFAKFNAVEFISQTTQKGKPKRFIEALTVFQFTVSIFFSITSLVVMHQMHFVRSKDLGFDKHNVLVAHLDDASDVDVFETFKSSLLRHPDIMSVSTSNVQLGEGLNESGFPYQGHTIHFSKVSVGNDFFATLGIPMVAGRRFSPSFPSDTNKSIIVNEQLVRTLGITNDQALGLQLQGLSSDTINSGKSIIGVVKDFNFASLKKQLNPVIISPTRNASPGRVIYVKFRPGQLSKAVGVVRQEWTRLYSDNQFDYTFLDEDFDNLYRSDLKIQNAITSSGLVALLLSFLGLFGLASASTGNRIKEIAIRNILGASNASNIFLLSKKYLLLVLIGWGIALPIAIYYNYSWLQNFNYRISLTWQPFVFVGLLFSASALLVVSFYTVQTALTSPSRVLRRI